jgi:methylated-DNA-[protein]-cysteine S-methyltransferase
MNMRSYDTMKSPCGGILLAASESGLTGIYFNRQKYHPRRGADWKLDPKHPVLKEAKRQLKEYFAGKRRRFSIALDPQGTPFQRSVWRQIAKVGFGETVSYGELARRAGRPGSARAAGVATGRNPIGIVVPCHRIVGANGSLTGYAGGLDRKRALLALEGVGRD